MAATKYEFKAISNNNEKMLVCPQCFETLGQHDIESFNCCPYCDFKFEMNQQIEDYLLKPLVDSWVRKETQRPIFGGDVVRLVIN